MDSTQTIIMLQALVDRWQKQQNGFEQNIQNNKDPERENDYHLDNAVAKVLQGRINELKHTIKTIEAVDIHTNMVQKLIFKNTKQNDEQN